MTDKTSTDGERMVWSILDNTYIPESEWRETEKERLRREENRKKVELGLADNRSEVQGSEEAHALSREMVSTTVEGDAENGYFVSFVGAETAGRPRVSIYHSPDDGALVIEVVDYDEYAPGSVDIRMHVNDHRAYQTKHPGEAGYETT